MDIPYADVRVKIEEEPEGYMLPSIKVLAEIQRNKVDPDAGCSSWDEQTDVNHSRDDPEKDHWRSHSPSESNDQESMIYGDEWKKVIIVCSNATSPNQDVPPEFEKVFVKDEHFSALDEQITSNEHLSVGQDPQPGCRSWSGEVYLPCVTGSDSTSVNSKGGSHQHKDCSGERNVWTNGKEGRKSIQRTSEHLKTKKDKTLMCSFCDYKCSSYSYLERHTMTHTGEKPFPCTICNKRFSRKYNLNLHMKTHTGEKQFQCKVCTLSFIQKGHFITHMRIHTGEKPFQCKICTVRFSDWSTVNRHIRTHSGETPFQCANCTKHFSRKEGLINHMRIHTGEKPFQCPFCSKRLSHKSNLREHVKSHTRK